MRRLFAPQPKIAGARHESLAEVTLPNTIHDHAGRQRIFIASAIHWASSEAVRCLTPRRPRAVTVTPECRGTSAVPRRLGERVHP